MFDLAPIGITTDGSGGAHHPEQQKHDGCGGKGRHDDVWERAKSVFGDEEEKREKKGLYFVCNEI